MDTLNVAEAKVDELAVLYFVWLFEEFQKEKSGDRTLKLLPIGESPGTLSRGGGVSDLNFDRKDELKAEVDTLFKSELQWCAGCAEARQFVLEMAERAGVSLENLVEYGVGLDYKDLMREVENEENLNEWIRKLSSLSRLELAGEGLEFASFIVGLLAFKGTDAARRSVLQ
jgi:hypothetical protein